MEQGLTSRQIRLMFALAPWDRPMAYGPQAEQEAKAKEADIRKFFQNIDVRLRELHLGEVSSRWEVRTPAALDHRYC